MRLLRKIVSLYSIERIQILSVFHLLETSIAFFQVLDKISELKSLIAIPYSVEKGTLEKYKEIFKGTNISYPGTIEEIPGVLIREYRKLSMDRPIIIIDVGGYASGIIDELIKINPNIIGIIEDTNHGHWQYEKIRSNLKIPVCSIAQSSIKSLENRLVGKAIVFSLEDILREYFYKTFCGLNIGLLGYGQIGRSVVRSLKNKDSITYVWDINPIKRFEARLDGHIVPKNKWGVIKNVDIIIGVSGSHSFTFKDIAHLKENTIIASGSSKDAEFHYDDLIKNSKIIKENNIITELSVNGKNFIMLNQGRPLNFLNNSVLSSVLELIFIELYLCIFSILRKENINGLYQIDNKYHRIILKLWEDEYIL